MGGEPFELFEVERGQHLQSLGAHFGQLQPDDPMVVVVPGPADQTCRVGAVDEADGTVVLEEQVVGHLADGRAPGVPVPAYRQQELMLGRRQTGGTGLAFAPALEVP
jgi:hypothetical protein